MSKNLNYGDEKLAKVAKGEIKAGALVKCTRRGDWDEGNDIIGNVHWVHKDINKMKLDLPLDYFIKLCKLVAS